MFATRIGIACAAIGLGVGLAGCDEGYGYDGLDVGYAGAGYYDGYGDGYYYGYAPSYYGWYGNYYYPGVGVYVYDQYRRPYRWNDYQQRYWQGRQHYRSDRDAWRDNWQGFRGDQRRENRGDWHRSHRR